MIVCFNRLMTSQIVEEIKQCVTRDDMLYEINTISRFFCVLILFLFLGHSVGKTSMKASGYGSRI